MILFGKIDCKSCGGQDSRFESNEDTFSDARVCNNHDAVHCPVSPGLPDASSHWRDAGSGVAHRPSVVNNAGIVHLDSWVGDSYNC